MKLSREKTDTEVRNEFISSVKSLVDYWNNVSDKNTKEKLEGLAFSILSMLDGVTGMPRFIVAPDPSPEDKGYYIDNNKNYYSENYESNVKCDISGCLHELFCK